MQFDLSMNNYLAAATDIRRVNRLSLWDEAASPKHSPYHETASSLAEMQAFNDNAYLSLVRSGSFEDVQPPKIAMSSLDLAMLQEARDTLEASSFIPASEEGASSARMLYDLVEAEDGSYRAVARHLFDA